MKTYFPQNNKKAFTLVELLVVVIILATLATIGVISYRNHMSWVRDTNRLSQLANMRNAIEAYATIGDIPFPEESVEIQASWKVIAYQWYIGQSTLNKIGYNDGGKDPKDDTFFTYLVSANAKYFQLLWFLEESPKWPISFLDWESIFPQAYAINYESRYPRVTGDSLGILTQSGTNTPIQEIESVVWSGYLDIENTNDAYNAHLWENEKINGTGANLSIVKAIIQQWSLDAVPTSCLKLLSSSSSLKNQDGNYEIYSLETWEKIEVYCDMTTDWGGWTILAKTWKQLGETISEHCSSTYSITNLEEEDVDYLIHCDLWQTEFIVNQVWYGRIIWWDWGRWQIDSDCALEATKTWINNCIRGSPNESFQIKKMSPEIEALDLDCDDCWNRRIWRVGWGNNYSVYHIYDIRNNYWMWIWNRESHYRTPTSWWWVSWNRFWYIWVR